MISIEQSEKALKRLGRKAKPLKEYAAPVQESLELSPVDRWKNYFSQEHSSKPSVKPLDLLPKRFANPSKGTLLPDAGPFDFERFSGFGEFLRSLEPSS